jgi:hypothetical protein
MIDYAKWEDATVWVAHLKVEFAFVDSGAILTLVTI